MSRKAGSVAGQTYGWLVFDVLDGGMTAMFCFERVLPGLDLCTDSSDVHGWWLRESNSV